MHDWAIEIKHLRKSYGTLKAVNDLSFRVQRSVCFGFLGPNGAGKTTTMKILYGKADSDVSRDTTMQVFGFDPRQAALSIKALAGIAPQEDNLDVELNVVQNLKIYSRFYGIPWQSARGRIERLLAFMELGDRATSPVRSLSGGMKRRLIIARALINDPALLILDEPTTGLDPQVRQLIWDRLRELKKSGVTILLTTHYMEEAFQLADRIIIMDRGKKVLEGSPRRLLEQEIESHVLELLTPQAISAASTASDRDAIREERSGERAYFYSSKLELLEQIATELAPGDHFLRPTNLEDLFLKATGRNLNELQ